MATIPLAASSGLYAVLAHMQPVRVRVATYNVLSSHLADPSHFPRCAPADLDAAVRLPRVLAKLRAETAQKASRSDAIHTREESVRRARAMRWAARRTVHSRALTHAPPLAPTHECDAAARRAMPVGALGGCVQSVIALQEVSMDWAGELHTFFAAEGYQFVTALYGRYFNGYMGVGLAWPISE